MADEYLEALAQSFRAGMLSQPDMLKAISDHKNAKRMRFYTLASTLAAAVSAVASAVSAYLSYLSTHH